MLLPNRKNIRLKDFDYSNSRPYFITICTFNNEIFFAANHALNYNIIECIFEEKRRTGFLVHAYCLMPNHLHLLVSPPGNGLSVSRFIGGFKSKTNKIAWTQGIKGKLWQGRFFDHIVRKREGLQKIGEYILNNPVRKGLSENWENYNYCGIIDGWD